MDKLIDEILEKPYWVIDLLPMQVPYKSEGQFFSIEKYYLNTAQFNLIKQKHINMVLKLNCYRDVLIEDTLNPSPETIVKIMKDRYVCILIGESMIVSDIDITHLTVYNPDESLLDLIKQLASSEGMFVWRP